MANKRQNRQKANEKKASEQNPRGQSAPPAHSQKGKAAAQQARSEVTPVSLPDVNSRSASAVASPPISEVLPFTLPEMQAGSEAQVIEGSLSGQFSGEDLEFESFMFDGGEGAPDIHAPEPAAAVAVEEPAPEKPTETPKIEGIVFLPGMDPKRGMASMPAAYEQAQAPAISGESVPAPAQFEAALEAPTPGDAMHAAEMSHSPEPAAPVEAPAALEMSTLSDGPQAGQAASDYSSVSLTTGDEQTQEPQATQDTPGWNDSSLASVEDFTSVLLAMRGGPFKGASSMATAAPVPVTEPSMPVATPPPPPESPADHAVAAEAAEQPVEERAMPQWAMRAATNMAPVSAPEPASLMWSEPETGQATGAQAQALDQALDVEQEAKPAPEGAMWTGAPEASSEMVSEETPPPIDFVETFSTGTLHESAVGDDVEVFDPMSQQVAGHGETASTMQPRPISDALHDADPNTFPAAEDGGLRADDLEFESFMFNPGGQSDSFAGPPLPGIEAMMPSIKEMEANLDAEVQDASPGAMLHQDFVEMPTESGAAFEAALDEGVAPFEFSDRPEIDVAPPEDSTLQAVSEVEAEVELGYLPTGGLAGDNIGAEDASLASPEALDDDFSDLPPIEPFDFAMLNVPQQEEALGFNTEELLGSRPVTADPMMATANLAALAEMLGSSPAVGSGAPVSGETMPPERGAFAAEMASTTSLPQSEATAETGPGTEKLEAPSTEMLTPERPRDVERGPSWTSTVTSNLSMEQLGQETDMLSADAGQVAAGRTGDLGDLEISPFDFTDINLDFEEEPTGFLDQRGPLQGTSTTNLGRYEAGVGASTPDNMESESLDAVSEPAIELEPVAPLLAEPMDLGIEQAGADIHLPDEPAMGDELQMGEPGPTAQELQVHGDAFQVSSPMEPMPPDASSLESETSTGWLSDNRQLTSSFEESEVPAFEVMEGVGDEEVATADNTWLPVGPEGKDAFKARVGQASASTESVPVGEVLREPQQPRDRKNIEEGDDMADKGKGTMERQQGEGVPARSSAPSKLQISGPLPALDGLEELQDLIARNPDDVGAHMALASAYTQIGYLEPALRVYRRILMRREILPTILQMIAEELSNFQPEVGDEARFHQVRGDLYMKQGRYQEAIEEYNKIS